MAQSSRFLHPQNWWDPWATLPHSTTIRTEQTKRSTTASEQHFTKAVVSRAQDLGRFSSAAAASITSGAKRERKRHRQEAKEREPSPTYGWEEREQLLQALLLSSFRRPNPWPSLLFLPAFLPHNSPARTDGCAINKKATTRRRN
jgi:hypothetical protein